LASCSGALGPLAAPSLPPSLALPPPSLALPSLASPPGKAWSGAGRVHAVRRATKVTATQEQIRTQEAQSSKRASGNYANSRAPLPSRRHQK
jgi:hypothetical protein